MGVVAMTKGVTDALNARQRISSLYTGGGVNTSGVAGAMKGKTRRDPLFTRGGL